MGTRRRLGLLVAALLLQDAAGAAPPVVTWVTPELSNDTNNIGDHYLSFLMGRLPGFDHRVMPGSIGRVWHEMQSNRLGVCVFNALKTPEREAVALFSRRPLFWPPYRLYYPVTRRAEFAPYLDGEGRVDLDKLAGAPLRGGVTTGRVYTPAIDKFIAGHGKGRPLESVVSIRQVITQLRAGRLDFTFATAADVERPGEELASLPVAGAESWNASFVACTRDKIGQAVIDAVDRVFEDQDNWAEFTEPLRALLSADDYAMVLHSRRQP